MRRLIKRIKQGIRNLLRRLSAYSLQQKIWLGVLAGISLGLVYVTVSMLVLSRGEIYLAALRTSYRLEPLCHDRCLRERYQIRDRVVTELKTKQFGRLARRIENYFMNPEEDFNFRSELALIYQQALGRDNPPDYLRAYVANSQSDERLVARLLTLFSPLALSGDSTLINPLDYYFSVLNSGASLAMSEAAVLGISNYPDRESTFRVEQIATLKELIMSPGTDDRLRPSLVMLLGDYYSLWPDETSEVLRTVYTLLVGDEISRAFSADLLNRFEPQGGPEGGEWVAPEVSSEAWSKYYER